MLYCNPMSVTEASDPTCEVCDERGVSLVIEGRPRSIGALDVTRVLPARERRAVGPFVFLDHMGPVSFAPGSGFDVPPHPHIGLSTVTYLFEGEGVHRDSLGTVAVVRPGEINLMTAGRGVVHSERSDPAWRAQGGALHGLQLWLGLPTANEEDEPSFEHHGRAALPEVAAAGARARVLLGEALGARSPATHPSRPLLLDVALDAGASFEVDGAGEERAVYVVEGEVVVGQRSFGGLRLLVVAPGAALLVVARRASRVVVLGGPPLDGERFIEWNFVSSSRERIERAKAAWRAQTFPRIPGDDQEFVPLPGSVASSQPRGPR
jgi:redox-sensitive bicupin YhaK (pirin superfamily)